MTGDRIPIADSRYPTNTVSGANPKRPYTPPVTPNDFPSVAVPRKVFTPPIAGIGPRTHSIPTGTAAKQ